MKITVLHHLERENARKRDPVVDQVAEALVQAGHEATILGIHGDLVKMIQGLTDPRPELVFNLMESFGKSLFGAVGVVGLLDLIDVPYVGGGPGEFYLQEDKALAKQLLAYEGIRYPDYAVFPQGVVPEEEHLHMRMPLIVKPLRMESSIGIDTKAVVSSVRDLQKRVASIHEKVKDSALVEEFVEGREFSVGIVGNEELLVLPPIEIDFSGLPEGAPRILDSKAKWKVDSVEYKGTKSVVADLDAALLRRVTDVAAGAYRALRVRDYGRIDLRMTPEGEVFVIEANASCYLEKTSDLAMAAQAAGLDHKALVERIVAVAVARTARK